jgi:hypothetical protein
MPTARHERTKRFDFVAQCHQRDHAEPQVGDPRLLRQTAINRIKYVEFFGRVLKKLAVLLAPPAHPTD